MNEARNFMGSVSLLTRPDAYGDYIKRNYKSRE
jgi:hypothetical protein